MSDVAPDAPGPATAFRNKPLEGRTMSKRRRTSTPMTEPGRSAKGGRLMQVGWDWASQAHDVTVMDDDGRIVDRFELTHDELGLEGRS
jgi:hypothetical protein